jgi:hypothetical protein
MRKIVVFLLIVGILIAGAFSIVEEVREFCQNPEVLEYEIPVLGGDITPCGGGAGDGGGAPG